MPRWRANMPKLLVAVYARYSSRFQRSIGDQIRSLYEAALKRGVFIPRENVFFDMAARGYKERRPGLMQLRALLAKRTVNVLLVFATNRLYRKAYKVQKFLEEEVIERGIDCVFLNFGVDSTDKKRWQMFLQFNALLDEFGAGMYADHVRAAHQGLFDQRLIFGTIPFGYRKGREIPGQFTKRNLPRC